VFKLNVHLLQHLVITIMYLGPMPYYSSFSMETIIGLTKRRLNSNKDPGPNADFVLLESAARHVQERLKAAIQGKKTRKAKVLTEEDEEQDYEDNQTESMDIMDQVVEEGGDGHEVWGPFEKLTIRELGEKLDDVETLKEFNFFRVLGKFFVSEQIDAGNLNVDARICAGARLFKPEGYTIGSLRNHKEGNRCSYFVRVCLEVDVNRRAGSSINLEKRIYFGDAISFFRMHLETDRPRLLALVQIHDVQKDEGGIWPYKNPSAEKRYRVISVTNITHLCARGVDKDDKEFIYWEPEKSTNSVPFGQMNFL
jgi:hypothetical protein